MRTLHGCLVGTVSLLALSAVDSRANEIVAVASIRPIHSLLAGVMHGVGEPVLLVKGGSSPHDYSLRPSEARTLDEADLVFWIGEGMEAFLAKPLEALSGDAEVVALSEVPDVHLLPAREGGMWQGHDHHGDEEHAGDDEDGEHAEHAGHGQANLHVWLDPGNAMAMVGVMVEALSENDPQHIDTYQINGKALHARLQNLDQDLSTTLAPVRERPFVVFHDAYQYFEERYGLNAVGAISIDPGRRPGAQRLTEIQHRLSELEAACVFAEPQFEAALVDTVIEGTSARKGVLDPVGAHLEAGPDQYFRLMTALGDAFVACLGDAG